MGLAEENEVTQLQFINLMALVVRETTRDWLKKLNLKKPPMQKSWSTSVLETGSRAHLGGYGSGVFPPPGAGPHHYGPGAGMPPAPYAYGYPPPGHHYPGYTAPQAGYRPPGAHPPRKSSTGSQGSQSHDGFRDHDRHPEKKRKHRPPARRGDPDGLEDDIVVRVDREDYSDDEDAFEPPLPSRRGVAVGQDVDLEPAIGSTILEETEDDDDNGLPEELSLPHEAMAPPERREPGTGDEDEDEEDDDDDDEEDDEEYDDEDDSDSSVG